MKRFFYGAMAAGLLLASGCGNKNKQDDASIISTEMTDEELARAEEEAVRELAKIIAEEAGPMAANEMDGFDDFDAFGEEDKFDMASLTADERQQLIDWENEAMAWAQEQQAATLEAQAESDAFEAVQFAKGQAGIDSDSEVMAHNIDAAKEAIEAGKTLVVQGHADSEGDATLSLALSEQRAEAVKSALVAAGLPEQSIQAAGYSDALLKQWSTEEGGSDINRRAELVVVS